MKGKNVRLILPDSPAETVAAEGPVICVEDEISFFEEDFSADELAGFESPTQEEF